jgi:hypothetical protein
MAIIDINIPIEDAVTDGSLNPVTSNAVFDALALKANSADLATVATTGDYNDLDNLPSIPSIAGLVPDTRNLTINGTTYDLSADRSWTIAATASTLQHAVKAGEAMTKGQAVYVSSADGTNMIVSKASNVTEATSSKTMGLIIETLAINKKGTVITEGLLAGLNTSSATAGDPVWLGTNGNLIYGLINKPAAPAHLVFIGIVTRANVSNGEIFVRVQNGFELQELHNVSITSVADNNILQYDSATSLWKNESLSTAGIQPTLVSATNIKTINGNSLLGSGDLVISGGAIAVGTTAVTSGTVGRVFFQGTGDVVQQDSALFWDNTLKRLTLKAVGTAATDIAFRVRNSGDTDNLAYVSGNGLAIIGVNASSSPTLIIDPSGSARATLRGGTNQSILLNSSGFNNLNGGSGGWDIEATGGQIRQRNGSNYTLLSGNFFGIGRTPSARLDVQSQGALSTDIAFRVRNSADTVDLFSVRGNGEMYIPQAAFNNQNIIYIAGTTDSIIRYSSSGNGSIAFGQNASITNATSYNTVIGNSASTGASAGFGIAIGFSTVVNSAGGIAIGDRAKTSGTDTIVIGNTGGATTYSGTRSIHLGRKGNFGNNISADDVFMTYFNSDNSSTLTRANGSFGLLGQGAYILGNGTGIYGTDTFMGNGGNTLVVRNHASIPSTNVVDSFQQYSADIVAGNAAPHFRTENGNIIKLYQQATGGAASTFVTNTSLIANDTATFDGYTIGQVVKALRNLGILA